MTNEQKRWLVSSANTFMTVFLMAVYPFIDQIDAQSLENGVLMGIVGTALRAAFKVMIENYLKK